MKRTSPLCLPPPTRATRFVGVSLAAPLAALVATGVAAVVSLPCATRAAEVSDCNETALRSAIQAGGPITFGCDGTILLTSPLVVAGEVRLDAGTRAVTLSGGQAVRLFEVLPGASLQLRQITLAHGRANGAAGAEGQPGTPGRGGAVLVDGGQLTAVDCVFTNNAAIGGKGGNASFGTFLPPMDGALGEGGAIHAASSILRLTNCVFTRNSATGGAGGNAPAGATSSLSGNGGTARGGAIAIQSSDVRIRGGTFSVQLTQGGNPGAGQWSGNAPEVFGGALHATNSTLHVLGTAWIGNVAPGSGGAGLITGGIAAFDQCLFAGNSAGPAAAASGGALRALDAQLSLTRCVLTNNAARGANAYLVRTLGRPGGRAEGGGLSVTGGTLELTRCALLDNQALGGNGAITGPPAGALAAGRGVGGGLAHAGTALLANVTIAANLARSGVSYFADDSTGAGGAIAALGGSLAVQFSTIAGNQVRDTRKTPPISTGAGLHLANGTLSISSSILDDNRATTGGNSDAPDNASGALTDLGFNLSSDGSPAFYSPTSQKQIDPRLQPLAAANPSGPSDPDDLPLPVRPLYPDSPAVNAGDPTLCPPTDQSGTARPQLGRCDSGAHELPNAYYLLSSERPSPQTLRVRGLGPPQLNFQILATPDWIEWTPAGSGAPDAAGLFTLELPIPSAGHRFFRLSAP